jgi:hypothetical protein
MGKREENRMEEEGEGQGGSRGKEGKEGRKGKMGMGQGNRIRNGNGVGATRREIKVQGKTLVLFSFLLGAFAFSSHSIWRRLDRSTTRYIYRGRHKYNSRHKYNLSPYIC